MNLQTERLIIREYVKEDWQQVHIYSSNPEVVKFQGWGPNTEEQTKVFIEYVLDTQTQESRKDFQLAITLKSTGQLIGGAGMVLGTKAQADIGYTLNPDFWGQGYATEAARALLVFGFGEMNLHRITATCDPTNIGSCKVLEKIGMTREGHLRENMWCKDRWRDSYLYSILEREFVQHQ